MDQVFNEIVSDIVAVEVTRLVMDLLLAGLGLLGILVGNQARKYLGEKTTDRLRARIDEAIDRGLAEANARGVKGDLVTTFATDYVSRTLSDTIKKLGVSRSALVKRVSAQESHKGTAAQGR